MDTHIHDHSQLKELFCFLSRYATSMLSSGATAWQVERAAERIASAWGVSADLSILPRRILLTVWNADRSHSYSSVCNPCRQGINIATATELGRLGREMGRQPLSPAEATARLEAIEQTPRLDRRIVLLLTSLANASFCRLFEGDAVAMLIVFIATLNGFYLKGWMLRKGYDLRLVTVAAATVSAIIATSGFVFGGTATPGTALATSVLYLVPGIPFLNSMSDALHGHHLCALSRLAEAVILTICLSLGLCAALFITGISWQ